MSSRGTALAVAALVAAAALEWRRRWRRSLIAAEGVLDLIGQTPLVHLQSLSRATGCTILGKAEFLSACAFCSSFYGLAHLLLRAWQLHPPINRPIGFPPEF